MPMSTMRRVPTLSTRYPSRGPMKPPSIRVKVKAKPNCVRFQPKSRCNATAQRLMAWNNGTVDRTITNPLIPTSHQP